MWYFRNVCPSVMNWILAIENDPLGSLERFWSPKKFSKNLVFRSEKSNFAKSLYFWLIFQILLIFNVPWKVLMRVDTGDIKFLSCKYTFIHDPKISCQYLVMIDWWRKIAGGGEIILNFPPQGSETPIIRSFTRHELFLSSFLHVSCYFS